MRSRYSALAPSEVWGAVLRLPTHTLESASVSMKRDGYGGYLASHRSSSLPFLSGTDTAEIRFFTLQERGSERGGYCTVPFLGTSLHDRFPEGSAQRVEKASL